MANSKNWIKAILDKASAVTNYCSDKLLSIKRFFLHLPVRISILAISLSLNVIVATQIFSFYIYVANLEITKTGWGLILALFSFVLLPGMFILYPIILLVHIGKVVYNWDQPKVYKTMFLLWMFMLTMYAPALLAWSEC